jgi:hypothetical protein
VTEDPALLYLETDDEVTSVVRRLRATDAERVVLVAPGRSRAVSSVVALRLLARVGEEAGRRVSVVGDALTRSLAAEAGLDAYRSVEDARQAGPVPVTEAESRGASIHVVRRGASDATQLVSSAAPAAPMADADTETRPVPIAPRQAPARPRPRPRPSSRRAVPLALLAGGLAVLLVGAGVLGAVVLPAATVAIVPRSEPLGPVPYEIRIDDPERVAGAVEATAQVTATGTYPIQAAATGAVVFFNWTFAAVEVAAGELVAAGDQAFATQASIVVPPGTLTSDGRIQAGDASVGVLAAAVGPAANVRAGAIDTVLNDGLARRLRGFPNNPERLVVNPEATDGGVDTTGPEITQEDVDSARAALLEALEADVAEALEGTGDVIFADPAEPPEPVIEGIDGLVETRDEETAEISGSLAYERLTVDRDEVVALAEERLLADPAVLPESHELLPDATEVTIGETRREGDAVVVNVSLTGASTPAIDQDEIIERIRGRPGEEARGALADLGDPTIELWPGWVESVPGLDWRIEVEIVGEPAASLLPSASPAP